MSSPAYPAEARTIFWRIELALTALVALPFAASLIALLSLTF